MISESAGNVANVEAILAARKEQTLCQHPARGQKQPARTLHARADGTQRRSARQSEASPAFYRRGRPPVKFTVL
jgi:hypothetical protein